MKEFAVQFAIASVGCSPINYWLVGEERGPHGTDTIRDRLESGVNGRA